MIIVKDLKLMKLVMITFIIWPLGLIYRIDLKKYQTIDKYIQEQINKEKEHWKKILLRIVAAVKFLAQS